MLQTEYAQKMGAIAVIIYNNVGGTVIMGVANGVKVGHLKIPAIFVLKTELEGEALAKAVKTALVSFRYKALRASPPSRGSPLAPPLNPARATRSVRFAASVAG